MADAVVSFELQRYVPPPVAVSVIGLPKQTVSAGDVEVVTVTIGAGVITILRKAVSFGHGGLNTTMMSCVVPVSVAPGVYVVIACELSPKVPVPLVCQRTFPLVAIPFNPTGTLAQVVS